MGFIIKLKENMFVDWSWTVDAPVTSIMDSKEMEAYVKNIAYKNEGIYNQVDEEVKRLKTETADLIAEKRIKRIHQTGTSSLIEGDSAESTYSINRAGPNETCISLEEIIRLYTYTE